jgi:TBC1 domain family protein 5
MHELLAPILYAVDYDSGQDGKLKDPTLAEYCSRKWVAADSYAIFLAVMKSAGRWYEWREGTVPSGSKSPFSTHVQLNAPNGRIDLKPYVAPIVEVCNRLQSRYLKSVDPDLWRCLETAGIEPQIYSMQVFEN